MAENFLDFNDFIKRTKNHDREFLTLQDLGKLPDVMCGLANSSGGWAVIGAEKIFNMTPSNLSTVIKIEVTGIDDSNEIIIPEKKLFSSSIRYEKYEFIHNTQDVKKGFKKILVLKIFPAEWYKKPVKLKKSRYSIRRYQNENFISSRFSNSVISRNALNVPFDDLPLTGNSEEFTLNERSLQQFIKKVRIMPGLMLFEDNEQELLKRTYIYSGKFLTRAGFLLLGENSVNVKAKLFYDNKLITLKACNLWNAYYHLLPKLNVASLSQNCSYALHEMFVNAIVHADYSINNDIEITITPSPGKITIMNPCAVLRPCKNYRLMKIFNLLGVTRNCDSGMKIIKLYDKNFTLEQDFLNFRVTSVINLSDLSKKQNLPEPLIL